MNTQKNNKTPYYILPAAVCISLVIALLLSFSSFSSQCDTLSSNTIRLHIVANSDSDGDQEAKYLVRDILYADFNEIFAGCESRTQAQAAAMENLAALEQKANMTLSQAGLPYTAEAEYCEMYFNTTDYGEFALPAGSYGTVRITLGKAEGKNWFCVAFPPLCVYAAGSQQVMTEETKAAVESSGWKITKNDGEFIVKFKIYELFQDWFSAGDD